jgi:hypothetical protein
MNEEIFGPILPIIKVRATVTSSQTSSAFISKHFCEIIWEMDCFVLDHSYVEIFVRMVIVNWKAIESSVKSFNEGFDPSLRKVCVKSLLARCASEPILKVGCNFWKLIFLSPTTWDKLRDNYNSCISIYKLLYNYCISIYQNKW